MPIGTQVTLIGVQESESIRDNDVAAH
jgi:hypothetical protein